MPHLGAEDDLGPVSPLEPGPDDRVSLVSVLRNNRMPYVKQPGMRRGDDEEEAHTGQMSEK